MHALTATCAHCFKHTGRALALEQAPQRSPQADRGTSLILHSTPPSEAMAPGSWVLPEAPERSGRACAQEPGYDRGACPLERALRRENASLRRALWGADGGEQQSLAGCASPMRCMHGPCPGCACHAPSGHACTTYDIQVITGDCEVGASSVVHYRRLTG